MTTVLRYRRWTVNYETKPETRSVICELMLNSKVHESDPMGEEGAVARAEKCRVTRTRVNRESDRFQWLTVSMIGNVSNGLHVAGGVRCGRRAVQRFGWGFSPEWTQNVLFQKLWQGGRQVECSGEVSVTRLCDWRKTSVQNEAEYCSKKQRDDQPGY